jgi:glycerophosphoryl diester phosphodiesterase
VAVGAGGERERRVVTHPFLEHDGPLAIAHRGGALDGRENSMAAFARAVELGYRYLETDVHVTADDVLVVFHDDRLDRVTDRTGEIGSLTWREVRAARIGGTDPIPSFADVLVSWPNVRVNVDPKSDRAVGPLVRTIRAADALDRVCIGSFSDRRLRRARAALGPRLCTSMGPGEVLRLRLAAWGLLPGSAVPSAPACAQIPVRRGFVPLAEQQLLSCAHEFGLPVHVWTVNDPGQMHSLLRLGVDGIVSDDIVALRAVLQDLGKWYSR